MVLLLKSFLLCIFMTYLGRLNEALCFVVRVPQFNDMLGSCGEVCHIEISNFCSLTTSDSRMTNSYALKSTMLAVQRRAIVILRSLLLQHQQFSHFNDMRQSLRALIYLHEMLCTIASDKLAILGIVLDELRYQSQQCISVVDKLTLFGFTPASLTYMKIVRASGRRC